MALQVLCCASLQQNHHHVDDIKVRHQEEQNLDPSWDQGYSDLEMSEGSGGDSWETASSVVPWEQNANEGFGLLGFEAAEVKSC